MKKKLLNTQFPFLGLFASIFIFSSCATSNKPEFSPIAQPKIPHQAPTIVNKPINIVTTPPNNKLTENIITEFSLIEDSFLTQNCDLVLEHAQILHGLYPTINFAKQPAVIQAAIYTCDAKAGLTDPARLSLAITNLKTLSLRYPFVNEAWLHNTIANFYIALNDNQNALNEKKLSRDLLITQQQDISSLNVEILKLDPSDSATLLPVSQIPTTSADSSNQSIDQIISSATQLINNDSPEQAISLLNNIPESQQNDSTKRLRSEAVNNLVTNLRFKVRALFVRSTEQTGQAKKDTLQQCEQILKGIMKNYPKYQDLGAIQNNLKQVQRELQGSFK